MAHHGSRNGRSPFEFQGLADQTQSSRLRVHYATLALNDHPKSPHLIDLFLWTLRRNEHDVIKMYDYLSDVMLLATGGNMLNFGCWSESDSPIEAQHRLTSIFGHMANLGPGQKVIDVGGGYGTPAATWREEYDPIEVLCIDVNRRHLLMQSLERRDTPRIRATATSFPLADGSTDRVLALESAQHFRPLGDFIRESHRVLKNGGVLALAMPVLSRKVVVPLSRLGLLSFTWSSQHYSREFVLSSLEERFEVLEELEIGRKVYDPLATYYIKHRDRLKQLITQRYPSYVEKILFESIKRMKSASKAGTIEYVLVTCGKRNPP